MAVDQNTLEALRLDTLEIPADLKVEDLRVEEYVNADGEDALRVTVVLADDTDFERASGIGRKVNELKNAIHDSLIAHGVSLFPYIFISTPSDEAEAAAAEDADEE